MIIKRSLPTYKRQRFLLAFLSQIDGSIARSYLQKLLFLCMMEENLSYYDFVPYKDGAYSFQLDADIAVLCRHGFLTADSTYIYSVCGFQMSDNIKIASERGVDLQRRVSFEYPYYAINSEIPSELLGDDRTALERVQEEKSRYAQQDGTVLFTIGYEGKTLEAFVNLLIQKGVHVLCDVRKNALSRKFGFSHDKLALVSKGVHIDYIHMPELGIASSKRQTLETKNDYISLFEEYAESLSQLTPALDHVYSLLGDKKRIALMCYEKDPDMCHRHVIRDHLCRHHSIRSVDL